MPKWKDSKWSQATIFGMGVGIGVGGTTIAALLMIDPATLHKIENLIFDAKAAAWAGALGTTGAVCVAVYQNFQTRKMWDADRADRENQRRYSAARCARAQYLFIRKKSIDLKEFKEETLPTLMKNDFLDRYKNAGTQLNEYFAKIIYSYTNSRWRCIGIFEGTTFAIRNQITINAAEIPELPCIFKGVLEQLEKGLSIAENASDTGSPIPPEDPAQIIRGPSNEILLPSKWDFDPAPMEAVLDETLAQLFQAGETLRQTYPIHINPTELIPDPSR